MSENTNIEILNQVIRHLIDSQKGYELACDMVKDKDLTLCERLARRAVERSDLISRFQTEVRMLGGVPETEGGALSELQRGFTRFTSLFQDDIKAALEAIDDTEDNLADEIDRRMETDGIDERTHALLETACLRAEQGEAFADRLAARV